LVVGAGGLLGHQVRDALVAAGFPTSTATVPWTDPPAARQALRAAVADVHRRSEGGDWNIAWCSGAGVVATPAAALQQELDLFRDFLVDLVEVAGPGSDLAFFLASSAGGVYAGSDRPPFTERTVPAPLAPYGEVKLAMEEALRACVVETGAAGLVGRLANLYGPGQDLSKPQGLVSRLCLTHLTGEPLPVYVSLDTRRDYLYVQDCAAMVVAGLAGLRERVAGAGDRTLVKVMATGQSTTLAAMVGESNRVFHRRARLSVVSTSARGQVRDLRLRSVVWPELQRHARTPLPAGFQRTADDVARKVFAGAIVRNAHNEGVQR
jgi:UDP-glucose 4-epimerase